VILTLLSEQEQRLEALRQKIAVGTEQIQQGKVVDGETVFAKLQWH
jgi:antitoxin ParD1/3/4